MITSSLLCLALTVYHEARSEPIEAQIGVVEVVMNRTNHPSYSSSICKTIYDYKEFSWTLKKKRVKEVKELEKIKQLIPLVLSKRVKGTVGSSLYFNHRSLGKRFKTNNRPRVYGKLVFY